MFSVRTPSLVCSDTIVPFQQVYNNLESFQSQSQIFKLIFFIT